MKSKKKNTKKKRTPFINLFISKIKMPINNKYKEKEKLIK